MCPRKSLSMMFAAFAAATLTAAVELRSPGGTLTLRVWEEAGKALYAIDAGGQARVLPSTLGLRTEGAGDFTHGLTMGTPEKGEHTETWRPVVGEQETQSIALRTLRVPFHSAEGTLTLEACVAEEGVALRYLLPQPKQGTSYRLPRTGEATTVALPNGTLAYAHQGHNQTMPRKFVPEHLPEVCRPLTLRFSDGAAMALCEADLRNSAVLRWKGAEKGRPLLKALTSGDNLVDGEGPKSTPWRVFLFAASEGALPEKAPLLEALNAPADEATYRFADWVRPGTCVRLMELNNTAAQSLIDEAARRGIRYILLDTGWYGPEYDPNCDPRLDPAALKPDSVSSDRILLERHLTAGEGCFSTHGKGFAKYGRLGDNGDMHVNLNLPALCAYAKAKGVGVILYVNGVFLPDGRGRFTADELFARFRRWGVAGVKPGFVKHSSQKAEAYLRNLVETAARHRLVLTIHDEWLPTGLTRTFPNLLTAEAILGDEAKGALTPAGDISALFTRMLQGPADHTFCWPGKATKGYALASPLLFRSGLHLPFWYTDPRNLPPHDAPAAELLASLPATWKTTRWLEGRMESHATVARETFPENGTAPSGTWFVASITANDRTLSLPLHFLAKDTLYRMECFADEPNADPSLGFNSPKKTPHRLLVTQREVTQSDRFTHPLKAGTGLVLRLTPLRELTKH